MVSAEAYHGMAASNDILIQDFSEQEERDLLLEGIALTILRQLYEKKKMCG